VRTNTWLPQATSADDIEALLPTRLDPQNFRPHNQGWFAATRFVDRLPAPRAPHRRCDTDRTCYPPPSAVRSTSAPRTRLAAREVRQPQGREGLGERSCVASAAVDLLRAPASAQSSRW